MTRLRARRHCNPRPSAIHAGHLDGAAEGCGRDRDRDAAVNVGAVPSEDPVRRDRYEDIEISGRRPAHPSLALAGKPDTRTVLDTRRDVDRQGLFAPGPPLPPAGFAGIIDNPPGSLAGITGSLDREKALLHARAPSTMTGRARHWSRPRFRATAFALVACGQCLHSNRRLFAAETVLGGAFLIILEDVVSFVDFFEFLFGPLVTWIAIGVMFHREFAISRFQ